MPEDCPHCLNRGGTLAQCGILTGIDATTSQPWERNYDMPLNALGNPMPSNVQATFVEGDVVEVEVLVTTHHKGHFVFSACPIVELESAGNDGTIPLPPTPPTAECFQKHRLTFLSDELYSAVPDTNHPERAYIAPASVAERFSGKPEEQPVVGARYLMKFQLPLGLTGEVVLLQWYYLTANR